MKDETRIAVILDRSGSMSVIADATIDGFNEFVKQQQATPGAATLKLAQFDDIFEEVFDKPLAEVPKLTRHTFVPRGMTALYDAIGKTIVSVGEALAAKPEVDRPNKVIVLILTDGQENSSKEYSSNVIANMIKHQRETYSWEFVFLGANQDAILTAQGLNIPMRSSMTYNSDPGSTKRVFAAASANTALYRGSTDGGAMPGFDDATRAAVIDKTQPVRP